MHQHQSISEASAVKKLVIVFEPSDHVFAGIGESFPNLEVLWSPGTLKFIERSDFDKLEKLKTLILSWNPIRFLAEEVFYDLINLESLYLDNCKIEEIPRNLFIRLRKLRNLRLDSNRLESVDGQMFRENLKLASINLSNNKLKRIDMSFSNFIAINMTSCGCVNATFYENEPKASTVSSIDDLESLVRRNC